jgi:hypothetical protein
MTYTLIPTDSDKNLTNLPDDAFVVGAGPESAAREACAEMGWSGCHVFSGSEGPIYGETGYEDNYCGWIDAR